MKSRPLLLCLMLGAAVVNGPWLATARAETTDTAIDPSDTPYPVVITPTRLKQSLADVPASVTVITSEMLKQYGITRIEEAFRMVPGMEVMQTGGSNYKINYHGTSAVTPRRMNVMIDGVSAYDPALSLVSWSWLPVALEDIDRIEIIRGSDSAAYGPNSMLAVINILTKHPQDVEKAMVSVTTGSHHTTDTTLRMATTLGPTSLKLTLNTSDGQGQENVPIPGGDRNAYAVTRLHLAAEQELSDGSTLALKTSYVRAQTDASDVGPPDSRNTNPAATTTNTLSNLRWTKALSGTHQIQADVSYANNEAQQAWRGCWPKLVFYPQAAELYRSDTASIRALAEKYIFGTNPYIPPLSDRGTALLVDLIAATNGSPLTLLDFICGNTNQNMQASRTQLEFQDTYVVSDTLRFVSGLGYRAQTATSETFLGGSVSNEVKWAFGNVEYRPLNWLTANLGGYGEHNSLSGGTFSPRMGFNMRLDDSQAVRMVFSKGTRSPDIFEEKANWSYNFTDLSAPVLGSNSAKLALQEQSPGGLKSEQIWSREIGYLLTLRSIGLTFDAKAFDDQLKDLTSERLSILDFTPDNQGRVRLTGAELQATWDISKRWSGWLSYSYLLNRDASDPQEQTQYARHSGAGGISVLLSDDWRVSLAHYAASGNGVVELGYARTDLTLAHYMLLGQAPASLSLTLGYLQTPTTITYVDSRQSVSATWDSRFSVFGQARVAF